MTTETHLPESVSTLLEQTNALIAKFDAAKKAKPLHPDLVPEKGSACLESCLYDWPELEAKRGDTVIHVSTPNREFRCVATPDATDSVLGRVVQSYGPTMTEKQWKHMRAKPTMQAA